MYYREISLSAWLPTRVNSHDRKHNYMDHGKCLLLLEIIKFYQCYFSEMVIPETNNVDKYKTELTFLLHLSGTKSTYKKGVFLRLQCVKHKI